jgi:hypothetical protein
MPVTTTKRGSLVGFAFCQAWKVGTDGLAYGTAGEGAADGVTTHARLLKNPVSAQVPNPARVVTNLTGGNRWLGQVQFGVADVGQFPLVLEDIDLDFFAMAGDSTVDVTSNSRWSQGSDNKNNVNLPQLGLMFSTIFQSRDDGSDGVNLWINYIIPRCTVDVNFAQLAYQAEGQVTCQVAPTMASKKPTGEALTGMGVKDGKAVMYCVVSPKPLALTTAIGAATPVATYTLGYKPTSIIVTLGGAAIHQTIAGAAVAPTSAVASTGVVTKASAGAQSDKTIALYETDFEAIA